MSSKTAHRSGWKVVQNKSKIREKTKLALAVLAIIIFVILAGNLMRGAQILLKPWQLSKDQDKSYIWNSQFNLYLVVLNNSSIAVISYNPSEKKVIFLRIPPNMLVEVPEGFGKWQLRSVYDLGESNLKGNGANLLKGTISKSLGIPIDGFLDMGGLDEDAFLRNNILFSLGSFSTIKTDLTLLELIKLKMGVSSVRFDKVENMDLALVSDKGNLSDGTEIHNMDPAKIDSFLKDFADPVIKAEHKTIAIFNATEKIGLAQLTSRIITNMGGNVIIISNAPAKLDKSLIVGEDSKTLERLRQVFKLNCKDCDKIQEGYENILSSRAQINVIIGEDFEKR